MSSYDLCGQQANMWCTCIQAGKNTYIKQNLISPAPCGIVTLWMGPIFNQTVSMQHITVLRGMKWLHTHTGTHRQTHSHIYIHTRARLRLLFRLGRHSVDSAWQRIGKTWVYRCGSQPIITELSRQDRDSRTSWLSRIPESAKLLLFWETLLRKIKWRV